MRKVELRGTHKKTSTPALFLPNGVKVQVEALGTGNQFVGFGTHPETKRPYTWPGQSPLDVRAADLPVLPAAALARFMAAAEAVMRAAGGRTEAEIKAANATRSASNGTMSQRKQTGLYPPPSRQEVQDALAAVPNVHDWHGWHKIGAAIFDALADDGEDLFMAWSAQSPRNDPVKTQAKWRSYRSSKATTSAATLFYEAQRNGWRAASRIDYPPPEDDGVGDWTISVSNATTEEYWAAVDNGIEATDSMKAPLPADPTPQPPALRSVDPTLLFGVPIPEREWIVQDWLPIGHVTLNYGDGGVGKTLLAQQLMTSCATATPWCGLRVEPCRVLGLFCEDDGDEIHRRQDAINRGTLRDRQPLEFSDLGNMRWISRVGADNLLVTFDRDGRAELSPLFLALEAEAIAFGAKLVVIDTAADTFGGNENDRAQVRQYIGHALNRLAQRIRGAVLLNAHPSRSGMSASGDLDGGSTGWSNSARSRWSLTRPVGDDVPADTPERVLTRRKVNYAAYGIHTFDLGCRAVAIVNPTMRVANCAQPALIVLGPGGL